jgi:hypothetical protein
MTHRLFLTLTTLGLAATGCADQPSQADYDDTAQAIGSLAASTSSGEVRALATAHSLSRGIVPVGFSFDAAGHVLGANLGLSYQFELECHDAGGAVQTECDRTTDRASVAVDWSGALDLPRFTATAARTGQVTLSGITTDTAVLDGGGALTLDAQVQSWLQPRTTELHLGITSSYDQLRFGTSPVRLIDGTIRYAVDARRHVTGAGASDHAVTIDAALTVTPADLGLTGTLVLDGAQVYQVDLVTGRIFRP